MELLPKRRAAAQPDTPEIICCRRRCMPPWTTTLLPSTDPSRSSSPQRVTSWRRRAQVGGSPCPAGARQRLLPWAGIGALCRAGAHLLQRAGLRKCSSQSPAILRPSSGCVSAGQEEVFGRAACLESPPLAACRPPLGPPLPAALLSCSARAALPAATRQPLLPARAA